MHGSLKSVDCLLSRAPISSPFQRACSNKTGVQPARSRPDGERPSWKLIWQCPVPPKVRVLAWRICRNALATKANLLRRKEIQPTTKVARRMIATSTRCDVCGSEEEDTFHAFMRCPHARSLWLAMKEVWPLPADELLMPTGHEWCYCISSP